MDWTPERVELLKQRYGTGLSASQVAVELGITRNAVMGKLKRLGMLGGRRGALLEQNMRRRPRPRKPKPIGERNSAVARDREMLRRLSAEQNLETSSPKRVISRVIHSPAALAIANGHRCSILELDRHNCHFPIGDPRDPDFAFCGNPAEPGGSYCPGHAAIAYNYQPSARARA